MHRPDATLSALLESGEIDALYTARGPSTFFSAPDKVDRLFEDSKAAELAFFRKTALRPPMHLMLAAQVDLAKAVHRDAGRLEQQRVQRGAGALRQALDDAAIERGGAGAQRGRNVVPGGIQPLRADDGIGKDGLRGGRQG